MSNVYNFSSDKIDIFFLLLDGSGSMDCQEYSMREGLQFFKKSFESFPEKDSIAISVSKFASNYYPEDFMKIDQFNVSYSASGYTALYYSIIKGAETLKKYMAEVAERTGVTPRATFVLFSDGHSCEDRASYTDAKRVVEELNYMGITTVFVAFGDAISCEFGTQMGFQSTLDVNNRDTLVNFLGIELSKSCKEQSKSLKALGANFFSSAVGSENSENYSQKTAQALDDDSWISDI